MASPRITIDELPLDDIVSGTEYLIVQDGAITKKVTMQTVRAANGVDTHLADATDAHVATAVGATSSGAGFDGANVQLQLGQLASATTAVTNQVATNTTTFGDHIAGTSGKHTAAVITADNAGRTYITGATVDAQLDTADARFVAIAGQFTTGDTNLTAHVNDTVDAHDATAVSVAPFVGMSATDVQAALVQILGRTIATTAPLAGGGDHTANRTLTITSFAGSSPGAVPLSSGGTTAYLRADGTWAVPVRRIVTNNTAGAYAVTTIDENTMVTMSHATVGTITLPSNATSAVPIGAEIDFLWVGGAAQPVFVAGSGATVVGTPGLKLRILNAKASAKKITTNGWVVYGDLAP